MLRGGSLTFGPVHPNSASPDWGRESGLKWTFLPTTFPAFMKFHRYSMAALLLLLTPCLAAETPKITAKLNEAAQKVTVEIGGSLFTELVYGGHPKPVLFPIIGPGGNMMVRQWPMKDAAPGEEKDHPHHRGLWFAHGAVNGTDFWKETPDAGKVKIQGVPEIASAADSVTLKSKESWQKPDGTELMTSVTAITCGTEGDDRFIDYAITLTANAGDVLFGDTKEGTMAVRVNPLLNFKGAVAKGTAVTSEGKTGAAAWGTKAKWVDYTAPMDGGVTGVACFDNPANLRFPSSWHARDYGLIAANPFGLHDFEKKPKGTGDHTLKKGESMTFKYRWLFHRGDTASAKIEERWQAWAAAGK